MTITAPANAKRASFMLRPWMVVLCLCILYLTVIFVHYADGPMEFIRPTPSRPAGYDGQFTYCIALDPLHGQHCMDNDVAAYRYQRILHPLLANLLALDNADLIPWSMLLINIAALVMGTAALESLLIAERVSRWYALVYGLFGGVFFAVRVDTTEPLAYGLVLLAILAGARQRLSAQALLLALAALAKETTLFFAAGYLAYFLFSRRWKDFVRMLLLSILPFVLWQIVLKSWLGQFGIGSGGAMATSFEILPFNGIWRISEKGLTVFLVLGLYLLPYAVLPTVWGLWHSLRDLWQSFTAKTQAWHPYTFLLLANAAIMPFVPFSTYREALAIARFIVGLVICIVLYGAHHKQRRVLLYSTIWVMFGLLLVG